MSKNLRIGLFITRGNSYIRDICHGAFEACKENHVELIVFYGDRLENPYNYQSNSVYKYANGLSLDLLIIPSSRLSHHNDHLKKEFLHSFSTPIIVINDIVEGYNHVSFDNQSGIKEAMNYFIEKNHCQNIGMISGYQNTASSKMRVNAYRDALKEHQLPVNEDYILYTPDYRQCHDQLIYDWIVQHPEIEAVMCAADELAICLYRQVNRIGKTIGRDIYIAGFDNRDLATNSIPPLASCHADASLVAYLAITKGLDYLENHQPFHHQINTYFIARASVHGQDNLEEFHAFLHDCITHHENEDYISQGMINYIFDNRMTYSSEIKSLMKHFFYLLLTLSSHTIETDVLNADISYDIERIFAIDNLYCIDIERVQQCLSAIIEFFYKNDPDIRLLFRHIFFKIINSYNAIVNQQQITFQHHQEHINTINHSTLQFNEDQQTIQQLANNLLLLDVQNAQIYIYPHKQICQNYEQFQRPHNLIRIVNIENGQIKDTHPTQIALKDILEGQRLQHRVLSSIYSNEYQYGLFVSDIELSKLSTIEYLCQQFGISFNVHDIVQQLNLSSITDELTGFYNRRGLIKKGEELLKSTSSKAYLFYGDIDSLKYINDTYGHQNGDFAIKMAASIMKQSLPKDAIIGRMGGDEFIAIFVGADIPFIKDFETTFNTVTKNLNQIYNYPFQTSLSYGLIEIDHHQQLKDLVDQADHLMYQRKKEKHKTI